MFLSILDNRGLDELQVSESFVFTEKQNLENHRWTLSHILRIPLSISENSKSFPRLPFFSVKMSCLEKGMRVRYVIDILISCVVIFDLWPCTIWRYFWPVLKMFFWINLLTHFNTGCTTINQKQTFLTVQDFNISKTQSTTDRAWQFLDLFYLCHSQAPVLAGSKIYFV